VNESECVREGVCVCVCVKESVGMFVCDTRDNGRERKKEAEGGRGRGMERKGEREGGREGETRIT